MRARLLVLTCCGVLAGGASAAPAGAVVGGKDAAPGAYPAVAYVTLGGSFACTGTLVGPTAVLTAGHCGSLTGAILATPIGWPPSSIGVTLGAQTPGGSGERVAVRSVSIPPGYLATAGTDVSLLVLERPATTAPVRVAGRGEEALWAPGVLETIVGYGAIAEDGPTAERLQEARVPVVSDPGCESAYPGDFDAVTQLCAGYPQGGTDTCQGDSGGPLFGRRADGSLAVVGSTSLGDGCARPGKPGVYARVADAPLREWIRSVAPDAVAAGATAGATATAPTPTPSSPTGAAGCASRRVVTVNVAKVYRKRLRSVLVLVAGRRVATLRGGRSSWRIGFAGRRKGKLKVQLVIRLKDGRRITDTRIFSVCRG